MKRLNVLLTLGSLMGFMAGCATAPAPVSQGKPDLLDFLEDGKTTKEEVLLELGQPSGRFEGENILTYRLGGEEKSQGYFLIRREYPNRSALKGWSGWRVAKYSLVLVFDPQNILREHSLVQIK